MTAHHAGSGGDDDHLRQQLQLLADISDPAVAYLDTQRRFEITNEAFKRRFGAPAPGTHAGDFFEGVCSPAVDEYLERAIDQREPLRARLDCSGADDGTDRLRLKAVPLIVDEASVGVFVSFHQTEKRPLPEIERPDLQTHLQRMARVGEMAAGLAHEIRQPLAAIMNYAVALKRQLRTAAADADALTEQIVEQARRADNIVISTRSMLDDREPLRLAYDVTTVLDECMRRIERRARQMDVDIRIGIRATLSTLHGNPHQIEQILMNLLHNALDAMTDADRRILSVDVDTASHDGRPVAEIRVRDTGPGVAAEQRDTIFYAMETTKHDGMGMGLSLSRALAERHGGALWAEDGDTQGAIFVLALPIDAPASAGDDARQ